MGHEHVPTHQNPAGGPFSLVQAEVVGYSTCKRVVICWSARTVYEWYRIVRARHGKVGKVKVSPVNECSEEQQDYGAHIFMKKEIEETDGISRKM